MYKLVRGGLAVALVAFVALQFVPVDSPLDNPPVPAAIAGPPEVVEILRNSCFDCHSNETRWPFYAYVAPVSWVVRADVAGARSRMNFSEWGSLREGFKRRFSRKIVERVEAAEMPLPKYLWLHPGARVTERQLDTLRSWRDQLNAPAE